MPENKLTDDQLLGLAEKYESNPATTLADLVGVLKQAGILHSLSFLSRRLDGLVSKRPRGRRKAILPENLEEIYMQDRSVRKTAERLNVSEEKVRREMVQRGIRRTGKPGPVRKQKTLT